MISAELVRSLLDYNPETGIFYWLVDRGRARAGDAAGTRRRDYYAIKIGGRHYYAHQIAWLWMTGEWPANEIDHRDCDGHNNVWTNLRLATRVQNSGNTRLHSSNTSGFKGVHYCAQRKGFVARIRRNGARVHLGVFPTVEQAGAVYRAAAETVHGEFARAA